MDIDIVKPIEIPVEQIITKIDIDNINHYGHFMAVKLARKHYESSYEVIPGSDFETNFLISLFGKRLRYADDYTKVKIGRAKTTDQAMAYAERVGDIISQPKVDILLYLCRFCSYTGGPGFPDLILIKGNDWILKYILFDYLEASQKMFIICAVLLGFDIGVAEVVKSPGERKIKIDINRLLLAMLNDSRTLSIVNSIEDGIAAEKERLKTADRNELLKIEDEISYMLTEKQSKPFFLMQKWHDNGIISKEDLIENMEFISESSREEAAKFENYEKELENDPDFLPLIKQKTEDFMKKKAEYMQNKFGIGESRSKALLRFTEGKS